MNTIEFIKLELATAEKAVLARKQGAETWRSGTNAEWRQVSQINASRFMSKAERIKTAEIEERILIKCMWRVEMFKKILEQLEEDSVRAATQHGPSN